MFKKYLAISFSVLFFEMIILLSNKIDFNFVTVLFALATAVVNIVFIPLIYSVVLKIIDKTIIKENLSLNKCFAFVAPYILQKIIFAGIDIIVSILYFNRIYTDVSWIVLDICTTAIVTFNIKNEFKLNMSKNIIIYLIFFILNLIIH